MNSSTAFATVVVDELIRCGLRDAVIAPGSRSAPLAMALHAASSAARPESPLRLHVRIDERSASFLALGLAKASGRPVAVVCTSGTAAAHFHAAVIEADEAGVPLIVLTADRPPELRGTGANQTVDQVKLYGDAVRWFSEVGVPEDRPGQVGYWRSLACRAFWIAAGNGAAYPGPVHLNVPLRDPLVPDRTDPAGESAEPEPLNGRPDGQPWTRAAAPLDRVAGLPELELDWTERGVVVVGDGALDPAGAVRLAADAGWPLLAEPSSGARQGPLALTSYQFLLDCPAFTSAHQPDVIVSAGRPGLTRGQLALLRRGAARHVVLAQGAGRWSDPARTATDVAGRVTVRVALASPAGPGEASRPDSWLGSWLAADATARAAADAVLAENSVLADGADAAALSEPMLARDLAAALPAGALLWAASSMPARDLDRHMVPRADVRVLASRGASGIDGLVSASIGAALAHQAAGGGPAVALLGDLAVLHDAPGLVLGPLEPRPDLCLVVVNNDGGGIFSTLEPAAFPDSFERVFGTPHGADLASLAAAVGLPYARLERAADLPDALAGSGLRLIEVRTDRADGAKLRAAITQACTAAVASVL
ncbi:MAG TPA: 2-succinyl-5-enolpyruvyl-6-hydroxy-3-cyclohexene-1-carboxylic-acid synthase [Streptosporangiaceae bacterium]|nr:2-succinyl-5-enolpyruvyl-6-hydroxy-3-cyclohexene-1-carboxylic-acid synthase [Streptosporangiaceae bacterium]